MPNYRRAFQPGGTFFFSIISYRRAEMFRSSERVDLLRAAAQALMNERPFIFVASVVLPDHMHVIWTLPDGDADFSQRIGRFKALFTKSLGSCDRNSDSPSRRAH